jgi:hypothetical protein
MLLPLIFLNIEKQVDCRRAGPCSYFMNVTRRSCTHHVRTFQHRKSVKVFIMLVRIIRLERKHLLHVAVVLFFTKVYNHHTVGLSRQRFVGLLLWHFFGK